MKTCQIIALLGILVLSSCHSKKNPENIVIDESHKKDSIVQTIVIDSVWAGHRVDFSLLTHGNLQYVAYYNDQRRMVVGQRNLEDYQFQLHTLPATTRENAKGTSTVLGWDSHNYVTLGVDKEGYIHLSGNMHRHPLTYFRSTKPNDISEFEQVFEMVGNKEQNATYPLFMLTQDDELLFHYRDGGSGNGNEIYNRYNTETQTWSRLLDQPLTDGQGLMNAYQTQPKRLKDDWYHMYWVWRDTPDCSTNHDLSYMKSPDLKNWFTAFDEPIQLPATFDNKGLIVDPIPAKGGIINLAAELLLDDENKPVFVYHKYDEQGNIQLYIAQIQEEQWVYKQVTKWNHRWEFSGTGTLEAVEVKIKGFQKRSDGYYEIDYYHIKHGHGTILLNENFDPIGKVLKSQESEINKLEGSYPGLEIRTTHDLGQPKDKDSRYLLKWETLSANRDQPREKPWPAPSQLKLYKLKKAD